MGLPLEMVHGALRCGAVYAAGVLGGSLAASVLDPDVCLAGASGGVYALLAAHLANALLNFHAVKYGAVRLVAALAVASCDVGFAVHARYTKVRVRLFGQIIAWAKRCFGLFGFVSNPSHEAEGRCIESKVIVVTCL